MIPIEVVFAKQTLDAGDAGYGALLASWGFGMVAGSLLFAALRRVPLRGLLLVSTVAIGFAYLATSVSPTLAVACAASVIGGLGNGVQWIALVTAVQELTSGAYQARVLSLLEALASAMPGAGFLLGGAIAALFEPRTSYAVAGVGRARVSSGSPSRRCGAPTGRRSSSRAPRTTIPAVQVPLQGRRPRARCSPVTNAPLVSPSRRVPCKSTRNGSCRRESGDPRAALLFAARGESRTISRSASPWREPVS